MNDSKNKNSSDKKDIILVVDDETNNRLLLKTYLSSEGYDIEMASTGVEAIKKVNQFSPSIIILDIVLPDTDGFTICKMPQIVIKATKFFLKNLYYLNKVDLFLRN